MYVKILNIVCTSFYGSSLWNLYSMDFERFFTSWNVAMRQCFGVDRLTHRYRIEKLHPKVMICSRLANFHNSLLTCDKFPVRFLARLKEKDQRTVFGQNLKKIGEECGKPFRNKKEVKKLMTYFPLPDSEKWRIPMLKELLGNKA